MLLPGVTHSNSIHFSPLSIVFLRAYKKALGHMKSSLAIFIDLHEQEKVAWAWLWAGRIHHVLGQNEVVDLHLQARLALLADGYPTSNIYINN